MRSLAIGVAVLTLNGCGLIVQGTRQDVALHSSPEGATVKFAGYERTTPATVTIDRKIPWRVVRASKLGHHDACAIVACSIPGLLAFFDFVPGLGISFVVDRIAGGLRQCPDALATVLNPIDEGTEPVSLPSDAEILEAWTNARVDLCRTAEAHTLAHTAESIWAADYDLVLRSVDRPKSPHARYGGVERVGVLAKDPKSPIFRYRDANIEVRVAPVYDGIMIRLANRTNHAAKVVWDEVVFVDLSQQSNRVIHKGVRYIDSHRPQPASVIAPQTELQDKIAPVEQVPLKAFYRECGEPEAQFVAAAEGLVGKELKLFLPIEIGGVVNEYTFNFRIENLRFVRGDNCIAPWQPDAGAIVDPGMW